MLCALGYRCPRDPPPGRGRRPRLGRPAHRHATRRGTSENQGHPVGGSFPQLVHFELTPKSQDVNRAVVVDYPEKARGYWRQLATVPDGDEGPSSEGHSPFVW